MTMNSAKLFVALSFGLCLTGASLSYADTSAATSQDASKAVDSSAPESKPKSFGSFLKIAPKDPNNQDPVLNAIRSGLNLNKSPDGSVVNVSPTGLSVKSKDSSADGSTNALLGSEGSRKHDKHGAASAFKETDYHGWQIDNGEVKISCIDPHAACAESEHVLNTLKILFKAYSKGDFETAGKYMDDGCTTFDEASKTMIVGKEAVLKDLKAKIQMWEASDSPLVSYTMEHPYAKVTGDIAVVSFVAVKVFGGKHPQRLESHCTDIFKKENGKWKKLHYRSNWKEVSAT